VEGRPHLGFTVLTLKIELFDEKFLELGADIGGREETMMGNESK
jgi:hypothetical protein